MKLMLKRTFIAVIVLVIFTLFVSCPGDLADIIGGDVDASGQIVVTIGTTEIVSGVSIYDFGQVDLDAPVSVDIIIENQGDADLNIPATSPVELSGTGLASFIIDTFPSQTIAAGASSTFSITFAPGSSGVHLATLSINSDDPDLSAFSFDLTGTGYQDKEISLSVGGTVLPNGSGAYAYSGTVLVDGGGGATSSPIDFVISNLGDQDLNTIAVLPIAGADFADFDLDTAGLADTLGPVGQGSDTTSFQITFDPLATGSRTATVSITSDDFDRSPYNITISGNSDWWGTQTVDSTGFVGSFSSIALDGNDVYIAYTDESDSDPYNMSSEELMVITSGDGGATWATPVTVETSATPDVGFLDPSIAASSGNAYVSYLRYEGGSWDMLQFASSSDGFANFAAQTVDSSNSAPGYYSAIESVGDTVYITYFDDDPFNPSWISFARSDNGGTSWSLSYVDWDRVGVNPYGLFPDIAVSGSTVFVSYFVISGTPDKVKIAVSHDDGDTWDTADLLVLNDLTVELDTSNFIASTDIEVVGSTVYLIYTDYTAGGATPRVRFARADYDMVNHIWGTWTMNTVDVNTDVLLSAAMAVENGSVYVSYYEATGLNTWNLMLNKSVDNGSTWPATGITIDTGGAGGDMGSFNDIVVSGSSVYISYFDWLSGDLRFAKSIDGGVTW